LFKVIPSVDAYAASRMEVSSPVIAVFLKELYVCPFFRKGEPPILWEAKEVLLLIVNEV
jgi:hypothetical protein